MKHIVVIGPAWPLRGGLATFNQRLAKQIQDEGDDCTIFSFSLQYPAFLFPGSTQFSSDAAPAGLTIRTEINSVNPLNWIAVGTKLKKMRPDIIVVRYWLPFMGPALGTILRRVRRNRFTKIIAITDNILPHEKRPGDKIFTRYFLQSCDAFITMSEKVLNDLRQFEKQKPARYIQHPLYDNFGAPVEKLDARLHLKLPIDGPLILFFGFIRKYKGLDILLQAMNLIKDELPAIKLVVAGEFYEDQQPYDLLISQLGIKDRLVMRTTFIPDSEVKWYLCAADVVIQPYRNATQSGVTPLAYHFEKPMIVTNVGSLPTMVPNGKSGIVAEPDPASLALAIRRYFELGENYFIPHLRREKEKYSWSGMTQVINNMADDIPK